VQDSTTSQTRVAGFTAEMQEKYPNIKILEDRPSNWDQQTAFKNTQDLIAKYGNQINGVWAADDAMLLGGIEAIKDAGTLDTTKFASDGLYPPIIADMQSNLGNNAIVGETFHRGFMAAAIGLYTAYLAATGKMDVSSMTHEQRDSLFQLSCVTPSNLADYTKWDADIPGWIDTLIANGPFNTAPTPLVAGGPEVLPATK
jgi:ribose transport system substrate-binding protein